MAAQQGAMPRPGEVACPDPAAHGSRAQRSSGGRDPFGSDGKLSAASAAAAIRYAKPHELPSFPTVGIDTSSGNRAANLANQNQKPFEYWKPSLSSSASKAAILATQDAGKTNLWRPSPTQSGHSAASIAMAKRNRAGSTTSTSYSEFSHIGDEANDSARLKNMHGVMPREMFTEHPPVAIEVEEKRRQDALRASSLSMAKQMFEAQRRAADPNVPQDAKSLVSGYVNLQEVAQRRANERLAKIDPDGVLAYREHYGIGNGQGPPRQSMTARIRAWPGEAPEAQDPDADSSDDDEAQAVKIRKQMNLFSDSLAGLDSKKRDTDREAVRLLAEKRVQARLHDMDEKVFMETGKASPAIRKDWEKKAREKAVADSEKRNKTAGKVHIGGGRFMDQSEIDAIAAARVQPTLDEITATAEAQRARDEQERVDAEHRRFVLETERQRERDNKTELKRVRDEERTHARNTRDSDKFKRDEENRRLKDERRIVNEEERTASNARMKEDNEKRQKKLAEERTRMEEVRQAKEARKREEREAKTQTVRNTTLAGTTAGEGISSVNADADVRAIVEQEAGGLPVLSGDVTRRVEEEESDAVFVDAPDHTTRTANNGEVERVTTAREYAKDEEHDASAAGITGRSGGKPIIVDINSVDLKRLQESSIDSPSDVATKETMSRGAGRDVTSAEEGVVDAGASIQAPITPRDPETTQLTPATSRGFMRTISGDGTPSGRNFKIKGFLGKFRRSSRLGQAESGSVPTLGTLAAASAPVAAVEASRGLAAGQSESAMMSPTPQVMDGPAQQSTVLQAIFGNTPSGVIEPTGASEGTTTTGYVGNETVVDRDVYTPTERAYTERATSIRSEGLYSEPSHQAKERMAERSDSTDISSISSEGDEAEVLQATRGRSGRSEVSEDEFEEARDRFDDSGSKISFARSARDESPMRSSSKFQEELVR